MNNDLTLPCGYDPFIGSSEHYYYDEAIADMYVELFGMFKIKIRDEIKPFIIPDWQQPFVRNLFGWYSRTQKRRRYKKALLYIPRKNGKTTLGAAITLAEMLTTKVANAKMYSISETIGNAQLIFDGAKEIIQESPLICNEVEIFKDSLRSKLTGAKFTWISSERTGKQGYKPHFLLCDELHDMTAKTESAVHAMKGGMGATWHGMQLYFTTADCERQSLCNEMYRYGLDVCENPATDLTFLPCIYHTPYEFDMFNDDERTNALKLANPGYGIGIDPDFYAQEWNSKKNDPSGVDFFSRFYLNRMTSVGANGWLMPGMWDGLTQEPEKKGYCVGGLDLASTFDMAAWCVYWPGTKSMTWRIYAPLATHKRPEYAWLRSCPNVTCFDGDIDLSIIKRDIAADISEYDIRRVGFDPAGASIFISESKAEHGHVEFQKVTQTAASLTPAIIEMERLIINRELKQDGGQVLKWMSNNCLAERAASGERVHLKKGGGKYGKIDGIIAAVCAIYAATTAKDGIDGDGNSSFMFKPDGWKDVYANSAIK